VQQGSNGKVDVFLTALGKNNPPPIYPTAGTHLLPVKKVSACLVPLLLDC